MRVGREKEHNKNGEKRKGYKRKGAKGGNETRKNVK